MSYTPFYLEDYSMKVKLNEKGQAVPTGVVSIQQDAFMQIDHTEIRWLAGGAAGGYLIGFCR